jgi:hypothetical protein
LAKYFKEIYMEREEILSKSRGENNDEYEIKIFKDSQYFSIILAITVCILFLIANAVISDIRELEKGIISFDYAAIMFAYISGINFYSYGKLKNKLSFVAGFAFCFAFICMVILYYINI